MQWCFIGYVTFFLVAVIVFVESKSFYDSLELKSDATQEQIRKQYRSLAKKYHPDKSDDPNAQDKFIEISSAYEVLSDENKKREYDANLRFGAEPVRKGQSRQGFQQFQQFHSFPHGQQNGGYQHFEFRTADGRVFRSYSYNFGNMGENYSRPSLFMQVVQLLWASPIPFFLFLYLLYQCVYCCASPAQGRSASPASRRENPSANSPNLNSDACDIKQEAPSGVANAIKQRKCICVVSCTSAAANIVSQLKKNFRADPLIFMNYTDGIDAVQKWDDAGKVVLVATSKAGLKWSRLIVQVGSVSKPECVKIVDGWITKLIVGDITWVETSQQAIPYIVVN